jgi:hypothetical protein
MPFQDHETAARRGEVETGSGSSLPVACGNGALLKAGGAMVWDGSRDSSEEGGVMSVVETGICQAGKTIETGGSARRVNKLRAKTQCRTDAGALDRALVVSSARASTMDPLINTLIPKVSQEVSRIAIARESSHPGMIMLLSSELSR